MYVECLVPGMYTLTNQNESDALPPLTNIKLYFLTCPITCILPKVTLATLRIHLKCYIPVCSVQYSLPPLCTFLLLAIALAKYVRTYV